MESKYLTVATDLEARIPQMLSDGTTRFPSESELCYQYNCSRQTIRSALRALQNKKLIVKYKGSGTYIAANASRGTVALILPGRDEYIYSEIHQTSRRFFSELNLELCCFATGNHLLNERKILIELLRDPPAGILLYPSGPALTTTNHDLLQSLSESRVPIVALQSSPVLPSSVITVTPDIRGGSCNAALRLMQTGKQRVKAVLPISAAASAQQFSGLMDASIKSNSGFQESDILWISDADYADLQSSHYEPLMNLVGGSIERGSAVFCGNDEIAFHMIRLLRRMGFEVPDDISVIGFDNSYFCTAHTPSITSVGTEADTATAAACRTLLQLITGRSAESLILPMKTFERRSTDAGSFNGSYD